MNLVLWIIAGLLAVVFLGAGVMKVLQPKEKLAESGLAWTESFSTGTIKLIGVLEILAAIGLILPPLLDIAPVFVPLAAVGLVLMMIAAAVTHGRRKEYPMIAGNVVLLLLAAVVAWGRFGPYAF
ncbi:DoxX family protein [Actinoplanes friuliensis]|uniref:DoxX family protein n=1 Tax=Actinoplanes friuliensis DSM 7358 TaxID=1246995 RepID=U5VYN9_9ACTN|nr:DoxX family protein [Actinoplanes friuliensis]AGZ42009.1 DoxX family protein [Actinoplanes friuliensis DSM 7358]